jgi:excisionase family DNA binding protein
VLAFLVSTARGGIRCTYWYRNVLEGTNVDNLITTRQAADLLGVCGKTIRRMRDAGQLRAVLIGRAVRYEQSEIETFIERRKERTK